MSKNIAIFIDNLQVGGIQRSIINLLNNIDSSKYNIDLYVFNNNNFYDIPKDVNIIYLKKPFFIYKFIPFNLAHKLLKIDINKKKYDLSIDFESYQVSTAIGALNCNSKKKVIWIHNDLQMKIKEDIKFRILYFFGKNKYKNFDIFCAVSNGALDSFKCLQKLDNKKYLVIPNFINTNEIFKKLDDNCDIKVDNNKLNLVSMGRLCKQKGFDLLLNNIKKLLKYRVDFHLYIIGDGKLRNQLENQVKKLKIDSYITFLGNQKNPFKYMKNMDLFVLMSRYEGQGMVLLEAKSIGLDVIIPSHLEKYCSGINGTDDIISFLSKYKKKNGVKKVDALTRYNNDIKNKIEKLFDM